MSQCLLKKYKSENKINEDNESGMGKCQKEVRNKRGKYDTMFRTQLPTERKIVGIKKKTRNGKGRMNLILSFATKVSVNKYKKKLDDIISSYIKSFHFLRRNIMGKTKKNNDDDSNNNNNQEKKKKGRNDINNDDEHDINVTSTATHNNNHNHKTHPKKVYYYTMKRIFRTTEPNKNKTYKLEKETPELHLYSHEVIKDTRSKEMSLHKKFYTDLRNKLFFNQLIQINHLKETTTATIEEEDHLPEQNKYVIKLLTPFLLSYLVFFFSFYFLS